MRQLNLFEVIQTKQVKEARQERRAERGRFIAFKTKLRLANETLKSYQLNTLAKELYYNLNYIRKGESPELTDERINALDALETGGAID